MSSTKVRIAILGTVIFGLIFSYQNCAQQKASNSRNEPTTDDSVQPNAGSLDKNVGLDGLVVDNVVTGTISDNGSKIDRQNLTAAIRIDDQRRIQYISIPLETTNLNSSSLLTNFEGMVESISVETAAADLGGFKFTPDSTDAVIDCTRSCILKITPRTVYRLINLDTQSSRFIVDIVSGAAVTSLQGHVQIATAYTPKVSQSDGIINPTPTPDCSKRPILSDRATWNAWVAACGNPSAGK